MGEVLAYNGKEIEIGRCPYCKRYVPTNGKEHNPHAVFNDHEEIKYCSDCERALVQCPVCQLSGSIPGSTPTPRDTHEVWYSTHLLGT